MQAQAETSAQAATWYAQLPSLDFDEDFFRFPHQRLAPLVRAGVRAVRIPQLGSVMLLRYRDVRDALLDRRFGAMGVRYYDALDWTEGPYIDWVRRTVVFLDPPDHDRLRRLVGRAFTPRQVARVRPITFAIAARLASAAAEQGTVDLYAAFAQRLPLQVICEMLAIPDVDHTQMGEWTAALSLATATPTAEARVAVDRAMDGFNDYVGRLIAERRRRPGDDLLSALIAVEEEGDRLSSLELVAMVVQLLYAGHETTRNLIGNGLYTLLEHPDQLERLRREPALLPSAVEEVLRYEPPIVFTSRVALEPVDIAGIEIPAGALLQVALVAANRDPETFPDPERFDITRGENPHLTFGFGAHFCLGASIARMEGCVAFETLLARFRRLEFAGDKPSWAPATALRSLEGFQVRLTPAG